MSEYLGRRIRSKPPQPLQRPRVGESFIDWQRRRSGIDAKSIDGLTQQDRDCIAAIKRAMQDGSWCAGNLVPQKYMPYVFADGLPESLDASTNANANKQATKRIAAESDAGFTHHVQPHPRRTLATDDAQHQHPQMSFRLRQVHNVLSDYGYDTPYSEEQVRASMDHLGATTMGERLSVLIEARGCGMIASDQDARKVTVRQHERNVWERVALEQYKRPLGDMRRRGPVQGQDPRNAHPVNGGTREAQRSPSGLTLEAKDAQGYCAYDGTGIELLA